MASSRSPRRALSRAKNTLMAGTSEVCPRAEHSRARPSASAPVTVRPCRDAAARDPAYSAKTRQIVTGSFGGLHRLLDRAHCGVIGPKHPERYSREVDVGDDRAKDTGRRFGPSPGVARSCATRDDPGTTGKPAMQRDRQRRSEMTAPLAGSPAARSMTCCDHRKTSRHSPPSNLGKNTGKDNPMVRVGSPIDSSSAICSDASRDASRNRPWNGAR